MSFNTVNQQNQPLHYSPQQPPLKSETSPIQRHSRLTTFR